ncbi:hypothetical protein SIO70_23855 [Chitinophaga sancti]|nr:hypothetical protein [Chitinophaga sancti]WPQ61398.1 hypothetical protein SIO70_23855 [Chitinophaga sancti]
MPIDQVSYIGLLMMMDIASVTSLNLTTYYRTGNGYRQRDFTQ